MCDIFYMAHLSVRYFLYQTLGVRYEIYTLAFPFDLRCQSGICIDILLLLYHDTAIYCKIQ